ncbi:hypothetical protein T439DRAFT_346394 [Meredithblackwellia eburnea MCA 4105]
MNKAQHAPPEILNNIFSIVGLARSISSGFAVNNDLFSAALVCKNWRGPAEEVLYRHLHLIWRPSVFKKLPCEILWKEVKKLNVIALVDKDEWVTWCLRSPRGERLRLEVQCLLEKDIGSQLSFSLFQQAEMLKYRAAMDRIIQLDEFGEGQLWKDKEAMAAGLWHFISGFKSLHTLTLQNIPMPANDWHLSPERGEYTKCALQLSSVLGRLSHLCLKNTASTLPSFREDEHGQVGKPENFIQHCSRLHTLEISFRAPNPPATLLNDTMKYIPAGIRTLSVRGVFHWNDLLMDPLTIFTASQEGFHISRLTALRNFQSQNRHTMAFGETLRKSTIQNLAIKFFPDRHDLENFPRRLTSLSMGIDWHGKVFINTDRSSSGTILADLLLHKINAILRWKSKYKLSRLKYVLVRFRFGTSMVLATPDARAKWAESVQKWKEEGRRDGLRLWVGFKNHTCPISAPGIWQV